MTPLLALGVKSPDISNALAQYDKSRNAGFLENVTNQKMDIAQQQLGMEQEKHDFKMQQAQASAVQAQEARRVQREQDVMKTLFDFANRADTPAKWKALTTRLSKMYGEDSIKGFEDFSQRPNALNVMQKATAQIQNYNFRESLPEEKRADFDKVRSGVNVNVAAGEKQEKKKLADFRVDQYREGDTEKKKAVNELIEFQTLEAAAEDPELHQGIMGPSIQGVKRTMKEVFGLDVGGTTSGEIIQKANTRLIQEAIKVQGRGFSDADLKFAKMSQAGLADSKQGFSIAIGMAKRAAQHKIQLQEIRENYLDQNGTLKGVQKVLRPLEQAYIKSTKDDLASLRKLAKSKKQTLPTAGMDKALKSMYDEYGLE